MKETYFIVIHKYDGLTDGTHHASMDSAMAEANRRACDKPNNIFLLCEVKKEFEMIVNPKQCPHDDGKGEDDSCNLCGEKVYTFGPFPRAPYKFNMPDKGDKD